MPALISLVIYAILAFVIAPFVSYYHQRYSQYLPLGAISAHTLSLRDRIADRFLRIVMPLWRRNRPEQMAEDHNDNDSIFDEEGELMVSMNVDAARREAIERRHGVGAPAGSEGRLSRDLEEGFIDDSDDEIEGRRDRGR